MSQSKSYWVESSESFFAQIAFSNTKVLSSRKCFAVQFYNFILLGYCRIREEKHAIFLQKCILIITIADFSKLQGVSVSVEAQQLTGDEKKKSFLLVL